MCRYSEHEYKTHWVCITDRHVAKSRNQRTCPFCQKLMADFGKDFKAPRKQSHNQWRKLELLVKSGMLFDSCGCNGPGRRPKTLADAKRWVSVT